jgi:zinc protease
MSFPRVSLNRFCWLLLSAAALVLLTVPRPRADAADVPKGFDPATVKAVSALYDDVRVETLDNGLKVYLKPIPNSPIVTTMVAYKVGSSDEELDHTGLSHYLEHLMFKGTKEIKPGDIDRITLQNGGANNAYTSEDFTIFHFDFASDRWEVALKIEADRMQNLLIDKEHEFDEEKGAVCNELMRNEDEPWDLEQKEILPLLFGKKAPYGHPVIGEREHVRGATAAIIKSHYDKWYHPNNASLVICGGFDPDKALAKVKELFGPIPKAKLPERKPVVEVKRTKPIIQNMESKFQVPRLLMGFNGVTTSNADNPALTVIDALLSGGKTSRLYRKMVEGEQVATSVNTSNMAGRYPGWFAIQVEMYPDKDRAAIEKIVLGELKRLQDEPVSAAELHRAQQGILASTVFARESAHGLADSIAQGVTTNDLDYMKKYLPSILAVTAKDVQRVAKEYFNPDSRVVIWSLPAKEKGDKGGGDDKKPEGAKRKLNRLAANDKAPAFSLKDAQRVELPNGLVLLLFENHRVPVVVASASVHDVHLYEPDDKLGVGTLTGFLLDEGTTDHTGPQIAELIEDVGGSLSMGASGGSIKVLTGDRKLGLSLLFECLTKSNFPKEAFERDKNRLLSSIDEADTLADARAQKAFMAEVFGKHPKGRPASGTHKTVEKLTAADCEAFYKKVFVPNNTTVAIVGDFDSKAVIDEVKALTANWKKSDLERPKTPAVDKPKEFTQKIITMPSAAQLHFFMGHVGITRKNPDYYKLLVMDYVLGTGPGFTDRLSARLRDREGLAYTVRANISSSAELEPGEFTCYIGTDNINFDRVKKEFLEELNKIRDEKPKDEEVADAKQFLLGNQPFQFTTNGDIAGQLLYIERYNLGFDYLEDYRKAIAAVTPEDVQAVAKKYLDPKHMALVAAGAVDADGKPLAKAPPPKP